MFQYDVIVVGAGPGGTACALELAKNGKKVALVEKDAIGGVCLNRGCIPSKTYLYLTELLENFHKAKRHGIEVEEPKVNWLEAKKRKDMNVKMLGMGLTKSLQTTGVEIIQAEGVLQSPNEVLIKKPDGTQDTITAQNIVLAIGSKALFLPFTVKGKHVIAAGELLNVEEIPKTLAIVGGGVTGVEMASVFTALGTQVTIIEKYHAILPFQDQQISDYLKKSLEKKGVSFALQCEVLSAKDREESQDGASGARVIYKDPEGAEHTLDVEKALIVIGRTTNYDMQQLADVGVQNDGRRVSLNNDLQTTLPNVYMLGDSAFRNLTAYAAEREGECVVGHILQQSQSSSTASHTATINYNYIPATVFSHPEVASIGLTEEAAKEKGLNYSVKTSEYAANAKAVIMSEREGMVKIIIEEPTKKILGVHMVGVNAADLIHQAILPVMQQMTVTEWLKVVWSHPVLSEVLKTALVG